MRFMAALRDVTRLYLDTAPIIYYVQGHPQFACYLDCVFDLQDEGILTTVVSPIVFTECLVLPKRQGQLALQTAFDEVLKGDGGTTSVDVSVEVGRLAADLMAVHFLDIGDALHLAVAITAGCDAFLTNDKKLRRVREIPVIVLTDHTM